MSVCYNCEKREIGCHCECEKYIKEVNQNKIRNHLRNKEMKERNDYYATKEKYRKTYNFAYQRG